MAVFNDPPITVTLQAPATPFVRADLEIHGVDHSRASYEGRIYFNHPDADRSSPKDVDHGYAGSFYVFGHGGCAGDVGHCEVPSGPARPADFRPEHQLVPITQRVIVTDALRAAVAKRRTLKVTIVPFIDPIDAEDLPEALISDILVFDGLELLTYQ
ncbi:MAG: hypothetical protein JO214_00900 [Frankiaceae bacterium]|nr:hypothetical protein [Frankiaceae bacterium]